MRPKINCDEPWLLKDEQQTVVKLLLDCNLIKFDPEGKLPLKSGGTTDVYLNIRNARSHPSAIAQLAVWYAKPLMQLEIKRFFEVPDSVSCIAGSLAIETALPYFTIRETSKPGHAASANIIGDPVASEAIAGIDDVVTDGTSKIAPIRKCLELNLEALAIVVLVDREAGWQGTFKRENITIPVWAGMTLTQLRGHLRNT